MTNVNPEVTAKEVDSVAVVEVKLAETVVVVLSKGLNAELS